MKRHLWLESEGRVDPRYMYAIHRLRSGALLQISSLLKMSAASKDRCQSDSLRVRVESTGGASLCFLLIPYRAGNPDVDASPLPYGEGSALRRTRL